MDDFPGLLAKDFGFKPQGKPVPTGASKGTTSSRGTLNFGIGSVDETRSFSSSSNRARRDWNSNSVGNSLLDDHDDLFGSTSNQKTNDFGDLSDYNDVFGGPTKYANPPESIFLGSKESGANTSSSPVYNKPVYDDDIFDGVSGLKSSSSVNYKDVFSSMATPSKQSANFDDLLGNLGRTDAELKSSSGSRSKKVEKNLSDFEDLLPGFGGSSPPKNRCRCSI